MLKAENRPDFIATAPAMTSVMETITRIAPSDANVLILGEHGTGKEVVAQTIHALSQRAQRSLVAVNTGALSEGVFESELFGHVKGAFTDAKTDRIGRFELAHGGTIFLDEIGNVPSRQQAKLLRVLESGEIERVGSSRCKQVDVRVVSATNMDLRAACANGQFREDLLFRLNTVEIQLPPLRDRREDIPVLAAYFLSRYASRYRRDIRGFEPAALQALLQHPWPGNVRELEHTLERAVLMCRSVGFAGGRSGIVATAHRLGRGRRHEPGIDGGRAHSEGAAAFSGECHASRGSARPEPWRALSAHGKAWHLADMDPLALTRRASGDAAGSTSDAFVSSRCCCPALD